MLSVWDRPVISLSNPELGTTSQDFDCGIYMRPLRQSPGSMELYVPLQSCALCAGAFPGQSTSRNDNRSNEEAAAVSRRNQREQGNQHGFFVFNSSGIWTVSFFGCPLAAMAKPLRYVNRQDKPRRCSRRLQRERAVAAGIASWTHPRSLDELAMLHVCATCTGRAPASASHPIDSSCDQ